MNDLEAMDTKELLRLYGRVLEALRKNGAIRSTNNPVADYAEKLVADGLSLDLVGKSNAGFDAIDPRTGDRFEIKSRRLTKQNRSTQLGALRNLANGPFDFLVGVVFEEDFSVLYAAMMPIQAVIDHSVFVAHTNSHKLILKENLFKDERVRNVSAQISA